MPDKRFYITTPIYYVNDSPHIGHAYTSLACDVMARFMRLQGRSVFFLTGTDEHGRKVEQAAAGAAMPTPGFTDKMSAAFQALGAIMSLSNDDFIRTTEERHKRGARALWRALAAGGHIYRGLYRGWYSVRDESFVQTSEVTRNPDGRHTSADGQTVEWVEEDSYFFSLHRWRKPLLDHYRKNANALHPPARRNEILRFLEGELKDLSISRTGVRWGITVPGDERHVMYVWVDALANYLSALGYPETQSAAFSTCWPADLHVIGKDILRFHAVYWPAFLMAIGLPLPRRIVAHGWWMMEGRKMSKSLGNVVHPGELASKWGVDGLRYFLLRDIAFGEDGNFSNEAVLRRFNGDLANGLGNLCQRVLTLLARHYQGRLPPASPLKDADRALLEEAWRLPQAVRATMMAQRFDRALARIWRLVGAADRYITEQSPWTVKETDPERVGVVLSTLAEVLRHVAVLLLPFMPDAMDKLCTQLAIGKDARRFSLLGEARHRLPAGTVLPPPQPLFRRLPALRGKGGGTTTRADHAEPQADRRP